MAPAAHHRRVKVLVALNACTIAHPAWIPLEKFLRRLRSRIRECTNFAASRRRPQPAAEREVRAPTAPRASLARSARHPTAPTAPAAGWLHRSRVGPAVSSGFLVYASCRFGARAPRCGCGTEEGPLDGRFQRTRLVTFAGMVLGYAVYYFTRLSFTYVGLAMRQDLGLSMIQLGTISSLFPLAYMNSKFLSGVLSDLLGSPVLIFSLGLMLTGFLNIAFSFASTVPLFTGIWLLNGLFQGCGATPCNKMLVNWFPARSRGKWWSSWNASHNIGGFLIPLLAGGLAARFGWRAGMMGPGVIAILAGLLALATMKDSPEKAGLPSAEDWAAPRFQDEVSGTPEPASVEDSTEKVWESLLRNKFLWCMAAMHFFIYFIRQGVLNWAHFYIMDEFGVPALEATARVSGFELGGLLGCIVSGQVSDWLISRYPQRGAAGLRAQVMIAYSLLAAAAVFCLWVVPPLAVLQWISMAAFGFAIYGPQTLITMTGVETVPRKAAATAGGLLAYPAQLGSMCAGLPFALLVQEYGWGGFFPSLILLSLVSATVIIPGWNTPSYRQARMASK